MSWLSNLPHQIPFRAASAVTQRSETAIEGNFLCTANDTLNNELMLVEAMAQFAGGLVLKEQGFVSGIDRCEVLRAIEPGDVVNITVTVEASFGGIHRFTGTGSIGG